MTSEDGRKLEAIGLVRPDITPTTLRDHNKLQERRRLSDEWQVNKDNNNLWIIVTCGDSRILIPNPEKIISMRSIDLGGEKDTDIFLKGGAKLAVFMGHFGHFTPGKMTEDCGGAQAKIDSINNHSHVKIARLKHYIDKKVEHPDVLLNAILMAKRVFEETGMPSIAVGENHRTGKIYPLAVFTKETYVVQPKFDLTNLGEKYNEAEIYANGIPFLTETEIPPKALEIFKEFLDASKANMENLLRKYPNLEELQETQNPKVIAISSKLPSIRIRYPGLMDAPNSAFKLHLTRKKNGGSGETEIDPEVQKDVIAQALYAITQAVENYKQPNKPFRDTDTVLIETSSWDNSINFAKEFTDEPTVKEWKNLDKNHKIIVIQNKEGISNRIEDFEPVAA